MGGGGARRAEEDVAPRLAHLGRGVEPLGEVAVQRLGEELDQPVAHRGVEQIDIEGGHPIGEMDRVGSPVAPHRPRGRRHLVQRHRRGVPLGGRVPAAVRPLGEERIEVARRPRLDAGVGGVREREVVEHQVQRAVAAPGPHPDVLGLDVAVDHAVGLEVLHYIEQVVTEPLQQIQLQGAEVAEPIRQRHAVLVGRITGGSEAQRGAPADALDAVGDHHARVVELHQGAVLVAQPLGVVLVLGDLQHLGLRRAVALAQQRHRGGPAAEPLEHPPPAFEHRTLMSGQRIDSVGRLRVDYIGRARRGQFLKRLVEQFQ